jgi:hypothetical protein
MPDRRMQIMEQRRAYARSVRWRAFAVRRGWQQFFVGLAFFLLGLAITAYSYLGARGGGIVFVMFGLIVIGLVQMTRGLASLSTMKRLEAAQAPLGQQQPWLLAPAAFAADGTVAGPGWLPDPTGTGVLRFWDGQNWTADTRPADGQSSAGAAKL